MNEQRSDWEPKVLAFMCNWCLYTKADQADIARAQELSDVKVIRVPCSGRINPLFILKALEEGHDGVLVVGCHPGDCHYKEGNYLSRRKFATLKSFLEYLGIGKGRVQFAWVSPAEKGKFPGVVKGLIEDVKKLGPARRLGRSH